MPKLVAAIAVAHRVLLLGEIERLARVAQNQPVGLLLELVHLAVDFLLVGLRCQRIHRFQQVAPLIDALLRHAARRHPERMKIGPLRNQYLTEP